MKKLIASSLVIGSFLMPAVAFAQPADAPQEKMHEQAMMPGKDGHGDMMAHHMEKHHAMAMAERLAAMETAVGIRSDQLDAWRKYTSSFMDMMHMNPPAENANDQQKPIFGERMADRAIERAEKAKVFKEAATDLRKVLDEKQLDRLASYSHMRGEMMPMQKPEAKPDAKPAPHHVKKAK